MGGLVFFGFVPCWRWVNVLRLSLLAASGCKTRLVWLHADFQIKLNICDWSCVCIIMYIISSFFLPLLAFGVLVCGLKSFKIQTKQQALFRILFLFFAAIFLILDAFSSPSPSFSYLSQHPVSIRTVASTPLASVSSYQDLSRFYSHHDLTARLLWQEMQIICGLPSTEDPALLQSYFYGVLWCLSRTLLQSYFYGVSWCLSGTLLQSYFYGVLWCLSRTSPNVLTTDDSVIVLTGEQ